MPLTNEQLQQAAQQYFTQKGVTVQPKTPDFGAPKSLEQQVNELPNSSKLTSTERKIYESLPGWTTWMQEKQVFGKSVSERLENFEGSLIGRAFGWLDIPAEGLERTVGLARQVMDDPDFDWGELKSAWYAGSLQWETANLPQIVKGDLVRVRDPKTGVFRWEKAKPGQAGENFAGLRMPTDLPGVSGLHTARSQIQALLDQGMDPKEALARARDDYYNGLGALALRAQMNDMWGHVLGDPLNLVTAALKPVQALKVRSLVALTSKVDDVADYARAADKAFDLVRTAGNAEDALRLADEAYSLAQLAGDTRKIAQFGDEAARLATGLGRAEDAARYTEEAGKFAKFTTQQAAEFSEAALRAAGKKQITTADKLAILLTGGDPFRPSALGQKLSKIPALGKISGAFALTPDAKARELMSLIGDNIGSNVIARLMDSPNAEADFVSYLRRVSKGAIGNEYGHAFLSLEGRTVQGFLAGSEASVEGLLRSYMELAPSRGKLELITNVLGESPARLLRRMDESPDEVLRMLAKHADADPALAAMLQDGTLTPESLRQLSKALKKTAYNKEMFFAQAMDAIETNAMRQAVVQFGVRSRGVMTRWSDAMKAAESLAFLRLSPGYPVRNKINNDLTMIARGLFGFMPEGAIDDFWKGMGFTPGRLGESISPAQLEQTAKLGQAGQVIEDALRGGNFGTPEKVKEFFQKIDLGKLDTAGHWGQMIEQRASRKAFTLGAQQFLRRLYKPKAAREYLDARVLDDLAGIDPNFEKTLNNAIRASGAMEGKFDDILGANLNLNVESILDDVADTLGSDVRVLLGDEVLEHMHQKLPEAIKAGRVDSFVAETRSLINKHIEDLFSKQLENVVEHVKSQAVAGGPNVWNKKLAEAQDIFWAAHIEHSTRMPEATRLAREASRSGDWAAARALWKQEADDARLFYDRAFRRVDAYIQGLEGATEELAKRGANIKTPYASTRRSFGRWKGMWEDFFTQSNRIKDEFFENPQGKNWDELQLQLDRMYRDTIGREDEIMQGIDDTIAALIPDPQTRKAFTNARDTLADLRRQDKEITASLRAELADLPADLRQQHWNEFWAERTTRYQQMRQVEAESVILQQGDEATIAKYTPQGGEPAEGFDIYRLANEYGVASATKAGARNDRRVLNTVNKYLPEGTEKFKKLGDIPEDVARSAFEARSAEKAAGITGTAPNFIADVEKVIPNPPPIDLSLDFMAYGRQYGALDEIARSAKAAATKQPLMIKNMPAELQDEVMKAVGRIKNDFASTRYQAMKFGEWRRDSALLNYNRRTNFDNFLGHFAPFVFWSTHSMWTWGIESIDRPAMLTNYMRSREFFATAGLERDGMASRTKGKLRIEIPFAPDWMGEQFIDPMRIALPFDNWIAPFEQLQKDQNGFEGQVTRTLDNLLQEGEISQDDYDLAVEERGGATWDYAEAMTQQNNDADRYDAWDFASTMAAPHAPLMWAYNAAFGDRKDIRPFTPASRIMRNAATLLGVEDWNNSKYNLEAKVRRHFGLSSYDKWDDYRIKRAASDLAGDGILTPDEAKEAIAAAAFVESGQMTAEEAKEQSEAYRLAVARSNQEYTGGVGAAILGTLGISVSSVPQGENNLRALQDDFGRAYDKYKQADESLDAFLQAHPDMDEETASSEWERRNPKLSKDAEALSEFFNAHPEYETRLGMFDKPEEQIHKFMIDQMWSTYNKLPDLNKQEARDHLGADFQDAFLNGQTRDYDSIPSETMQVWMKLMQADTLGGLSADQRMLVNLYGKVAFTEPETAQRVQVFYDTRRSTFPEYYDLQSGYYAKPKGKQRKAYLKANPQLEQYWDWRKGFMFSNPDLVQYLTDNEQEIAKAQERARSQASVPTAAELQQVAAQLPAPARELLADSAASGEPLPAVLVSYLDGLAAEQGLTVEQFVEILGTQR